MSASLLVVDDEEPLRQALEYLVRRAGHRVVTAATGEAAVEIVQRDHPDLVLLDVELPGRNGYDVCQSIRRDPNVADTLILMLSARTAEVDVAKGLAVGADAYLGKPFSATELIDQVNALLARRGDHA
jgi:DNA-binding response OmpR family regulator